MNVFSKVNSDGKGSGPPNYINHVLTSYYGVTDQLVLTAFRCPRLYSHLFTLLRTTFDFEDSTTFVHPE